mmetsp:Transcript_130314/g.243812  ORF Transcript_130314/g.243812 Transcript_130314/m.243812 type:complete len:213 (+) Transcript_130314:381-1019(+)
MHIGSICSQPTRILTVRSRFNRVGIIDGFAELGASGLFAGCLGFPAFGFYDVSSVFCPARFCCGIVRHGTIRLCILAVSPRLHASWSVYVFAERCSSRRFSVSARLHPFGLVTFPEEFWAYRFSIRCIWNVSTCFLSGIVGVCKIRFIIVSEKLHSSGGVTVSDRFLALRRILVSAEFCTHRVFVFCIWYAENGRVCVSPGLRNLRQYDGSS